MKARPLPLALPRAAAGRCPGALWALSVLPEQLLWLPLAPALFWERSFCVFILLTCFWGPLWEGLPPSPAHSLPSGP